MSVSRLCSDEAFNLHQIKTSNGFSIGICFPFQAHDDQGKESHTPTSRNEKLSTVLFCFFYCLIDHQVPQVHQVCKLFAISFRSLLIPSLCENININLQIRWEKHLQVTKIWYESLQTRWLMSNVLMCQLSISHSAIQLWLSQKEKKLSPCLKQ